MTLTTSSMTGHNCDKLKNKQTGLVTVILAQGHQNWYQSVKPMQPIMKYSLKDLTFLAFQKKANIRVLGTDSWRVQHAEQTGTNTPHCIHSVDFLQVKNPTSASLKLV